MGPKFAEPLSDRYIVFTKEQRRIVIPLVGFAMLFSPSSASIYISTLSKLEADLHTSAQPINLTMTSGLVGTV